MSEQRDVLPGILGCLGGLGCGAALLVIGISGALFYAGTSSVNSSPPISTPAPPTPFPTPIPPSMPLPPPPVLPTPPLAPPGVLAPAGDLSPRLVHATVTAVSGDGAGIAVGASCDFNVERENAADGSFVCNAQVVCGGRLLYGGPGAGYFPCTLYAGPPRHVVGADLNTTTADHDGAMSLDTHGTLELWDDATGPNGEFRVTATVVSVE
jgi:hypothetical protein